jgi:phenylalanyl-tRNA synthetase beta chain
MKISRNWLQTFFETPLPDAVVLADALTFHIFEIDGIEEKGNDSVLDVKVTANRGHDCLSHYGVAKELSAILKLPLKEYPHTLAISTIGEMKTDALRVASETPLCRRHINGLIRGVKVGPSPEWLVERLAAMGQRSINNIVDATNFVMFNIGQPTHVFDAAKLGTDENSAHVATVREARTGESITTLDGKDLALSPGMLIIVDAADRPLDIAGVKGGKQAELDANTTDIVIEAANFDGVSVRKTAAALKLRTDASARFEQGLSPELAAYGMRAVAELIREIAGGEIVGFADLYPQPQKIEPVSVTLAQTNAVLGTNLAAADIADVFTRLGLIYQTSEEKGSDTFTVTPPFERLDLVIPEDLIEEVGCIVGYDTVPEVELPEGQTQAVANEACAWAERIRAHLTAQGFSEVFTSVFADTGERLVANKVDGVRPYLRTNLSDGLADALERNIRIKDLLGVEQVKLFEIGTVWRNGNEEIIYDLAVEKLKKHKTAEDYKQELDEILHHTQNLGSDTSYAPSYNTPPEVQYRPFSKYPFIVRDIAMWTPTGTDADAVLADVRAQAGELCVRAALFDRFEKEGRVSLAFRLVFQSFEKTLTDDEVNDIMERIPASLAARSFEIR